jgi:hypothetical protein
MTPDYIMKHLSYARSFTLLMKKLAQKFLGKKCLKSGIYRSCDLAHGAGKHAGNRE